MPHIDRRRNVVSFTLMVAVASPVWRIVAAPPQMRSSAKSILAHPVPWVHMPPPDEENDHAVSVALQHPAAAGQSRRGGTRGGVGG